MNHKTRGAANKDDGKDNTAEESTGLAQRNGKHLADQDGDQKSRPVGSREFKFNRQLATARGRGQRQRKGNQANASPANQADNQSVGNR